MKDESIVRKKPTELFLVRNHADLSCLPEAVSYHEDFSSAIEAVRDEIEPSEPDYPFYEEEVIIDTLTEGELKKWGSYVLASVIGEHALGGIVIAYTDDEDLIDEWWDEETGEWRNL